MTVLRIAGPLFFANAAVVARRVRQEGAAGSLVLDMEAVTDLDVTGAQQLRLALEHLRSHGTGIAYTRLQPALRERLERLGLLDGAAQFRTNRAAVEALSKGTQET